MNITKTQTPCGVSRCTFLDAERDIIYVVDGGEALNEIVIATKIIFFEIILAISFTKIKVFKYRWECQL